VVKSAGLRKGPVMPGSTTDAAFAMNMARTAWRRIRKMRLSPPAKAEKSMAACSPALDHRAFQPHSHGLAVTAQPAELAGLKLTPRPEVGTSMLATLQTM
jgi:hypothetical protein